MQQKEKTEMYKNIMRNVLHKEFFMDKHAYVFMNKLRINTFNNKFFKHIAELIKEEDGDYPKWWNKMIQLYGK